MFRKLKSFRANPVNKLDFRATYLELVKSLKQTHDTEQAMKLAVGGEFEAIGLLELETLKHFGLKEDSYVIDVGCGCGRLAKPLSQYLMGRYTGIDIVPELVNHAHRIVGRPDWRFEVAKGLNIPEEDGVADMVCFFSVFTHLLHEQTYVYLREAKRVLKPGGKIVFSFLDFTIPGHWEVFESNIADLDVNSHPLNMFISKDAIKIWAEHLGLQVQAIEDGNKPYVPLSKPIIFENGSALEKLAAFGQSVCELHK
jgi:ubiquinone/menaquinone biosynthesis C-methylase UbiE